MTSCLISSRIVELCVEPADVDVLEGDSNCGFGGCSSKRLPGVSILRRFGLVSDVESEGRGFLVVM